MTLAACAACTAPQPLDRQTWFAVPFGVFDRRQTGNDPVDDGLGAGIDGGFDLNADLVLASWEIGASWSDQDVVGGKDLGVSRLTTGLRFTSRLPNAPIGAYVRGGGMWRDEASHDSAVYMGNDQSGVYLGAGIEWWFSSSATLGPFVFYTRGAEDDLEETWIGITSRFYLTE